MSEITFTTFTVRHKESVNQLDIIKQFKNEGCDIVYVDHHSGETTVSCPDFQALSYKAWLWRVIVKWDGKTVKFSDPDKEAKKAAQKELLKNIQKMEKGEATWMEPDLEGYYHERHNPAKPRWMCKICGLVWTMKHDALECEGRGHKDSYVLNYGGTIVNGQWKGGTQYTISAVRKEKVQ
jgi:hypothetical protein